MAQHALGYDGDAHATTGTDTDLRVQLDAARSQCPVMHTDDGQVTLLGHAEVRDAALDAETFSSAVSRYRAIPNSLDGAEHHKYRALIDVYFTDAEVASQEPQCTAHAKQIIAALPRGELVRTVIDIGTTFAVRAQCTWLGWPRSVEDNRAAAVPEITRSSLRSLSALTRSLRGSSSTLAPVKTTVLRLASCETPLTEGPSSRPRSCRIGASSPGTRS